MRFFAVHHRDRYGWDGPPIHDAVAVAWLVGAGAWSARARCAIDVETGGDARRAAGRSPTARACPGGRRTPRSGWPIDRAGLIDLVVDAVGRFP